ncbi:Alpha-amylase isozyme 2A [Cocos nucifera]|uniref:alpha-amylase n=1 Tax=Cocos nucifera TaxID=13894 RepID=A0A8K0ICJ4_COCNU|nr:Alpha-amylase isozyme 2A [Cocos nucifera]
MAIATCADATLWCLSRGSLDSRKRWLQISPVCCRWQLKVRRNFSDRKRKNVSINDGFRVFGIRVRAGPDESNDAFKEIVGDGDHSLQGNGNVPEIAHDELALSNIALSEARSNQEAIGKERDELLEESAHSQAKLQEYADMIKHDKELAVAELEAAESLFNHKLQESTEDSVALESKLVLAKQDAIELAVQVEKLAELAFRQATSHILEDAWLRVSAVETSAAEAAYCIEEQIRSASEGTISSIADQSTNAINKALSEAEQARSYAEKAVSALSGGANLIDEITTLRSQNFTLQNAVSDLEYRLLIMRSEAERLKSELEQALAQAKASYLRANAAEKALNDLQELIKKKSVEKDEEVRSLLEKMEEVAERERETGKAFKVELESIMAAVEAIKETACLKDQAYMRRCAALQRSLKASEAASEVWRWRAEIAESILHGEKSPGEDEEDVDYLVNEGRIDLLTGDDSQKWKLLAEGPRREIPEWMARRIRTICPKLPPRKVNMSEALAAKSLSLNLPKPDEVWSIAQEKPKEADILVEHVIEKEAIEKKRKALERALQRKTVKWQRTPEETKLEPGTGTGREIMFQGFNWESWRRRWYLELAPKAADLSQSGVTAVWFPPPTESVAPQGYMPSDLYNLNSCYGSVEELKQCIEEMHAHDLLSPNGVWNIFGGKLAWGPEAIVCDDPNFQGRGNPSTGDIFHAAPNIDHSQEFVRRDIKDWLNWLRNDVGFDGWRLDFVRGFSGGYVKEYIEASNPAFAIGEYWDSLAYEGGNLCYNQGIVIPFRAGHWPFPRDKLGQGYAYILTHPGTPVIFYDHFYDFGLRDTIIELIEARRRAGIHCRSPVIIYHANNEGYVAKVDSSLVMKIGYFDWNPSKENNMEGIWQKFVDKGSDYQIWLRQ